MEKSDIIVSARSVIVSDNNEILLVQRSINDLHNPSKWELPGGKVEAGYDIADTQVREIYEETSLIIEPNNSNMYVESYVIKNGRYANSTYISVVGLARVIKGEVSLSNEHDKFAWLYQKSISDGNYDITTISTNALKFFGIFNPKLDS
jgi:8-oxo-dGTP diphosphatase